MSYQKKNLKLTEREIEIILFLNKSKTPQSIDILQKEVWGYSENLETHTVETHIHRLRKKFENAAPVPHMPGGVRTMILPLNLPHINKEVGS